MLSCSAAPFHLALDDLLFSGQGDRWLKNIAALTLLHELETNGRAATDAERRVLAHYTAFGESALLNRLFRFDPTSGRYMLTGTAAAFLAADDARHLRSAALTAFYTPLPLIAIIWEALERLGLGELHQPRIIEPAAGVGHMISAMPPTLRARAAISAVELDPIAARILRHLHPDITLHGGVGFEAVDLPSNGFDLAISNVPFGALSVHDPQTPAVLRQTLHDYFFAKALRLVRPGGLVVFLTSWGTLDKQTTTVRAWLAEQATLLGAFRLPNGVFATTSGSASAADLLILQKKVEPCHEQPRWFHLAPADYPRSSEHRSMTSGSRYTRQFKDPEQLQPAQVVVNQCWLDEPARVVGQPLVVAQDGCLWLQVAPPAGDLAATLAERMQALLPMVTISPVLADAQEHPLNGSLVAPLSQRRTEQLPLLTSTGPGARRVEGLITIYNAAKRLIRAELVDDPACDTARGELNTIYDRFVAHYSVIHDPRTLRLFRDRPELQFLLALESNPRTSRNGHWFADKAALFFTRTLRPLQRALPGTLTPIEALLRCLDERGTFDLPYVAALAGCEERELLEQLGPRIYQMPGSERYELADVYLSGDVHAKLRDARAWAERDPTFARNVAALEAVQPAPLGPRDIIVNLNAFWLPGEVVSAFIRTLLPAWTGTASYHSALSVWMLSDPDERGASAVEATTRWGTGRADAMTILVASLRGVPITVYDTVQVGDSERRVLNPQETVAAQEKQQAIATAFEQWLWEDGARADHLCALYNERFNRVRMRTYDGSHLSFPGMSTHLLRDGDLASYQKDAVWQILQNRSTLLGFAVGGGKTFTAVAAAIEARRLGLCTTALAVVPNTLVSQWANEARRLYPGIKVLAMGPEDFERQRRGVLLSRIATGDWDVVVIAHTSFLFLPLSANLLQSFREAETDRLRAYLEEQRASATSSDDTRSLKQIECAVRHLEQRLTSMADAIARDSARTITWEELGIDMLIVDEAHAFKNLHVPTRLSGIAGLPSAQSQRALDMRIKTWDLLRRHKKVVFLTATPIMNTIGEAYVMQLYLQEEQLQAAGIHHFDEWVSLYAQPRMAFELKPDGSGFRMHTRLATFVNLPELASMWRQVLTLRTKKQMGLPEPALVTGKVIPVVVPASPTLRRYIQTLATRAEAVRTRRVDPSVDNMLRIVSDGRKAALDMRLIDRRVGRAPRSKIGALVATVAQIHATFAPLRGTQLIFCDLATPKGNGAGERAGDPPPTSACETAASAQHPHQVETAEEVSLANFVYDEIRDELVARGIPRTEVAFIHEARTKAQRDALFAAMNDGRVRVLIGSTALLSTGVNVQQRLIALHNLDCPWRPGDLEQRHGRIVRQGNVWPEVYVFAYLTEGSFDGYMWQTIERKAAFIEQALAGEITARTIADPSEVVLSAAEIKAIASGNPAVVRKVQREAEIARLERVRAVWRDTRRSLHIERGQVEDEQRRIARRVAVWQQAAATVARERAEPFAAAISTHLGSDRFEQCTTRVEAGATLRALVEQAAAQATGRQQRLRVVGGQYRGLALVVDAHRGGGADLVLALPAGDMLDSVIAPTDTGIWQRITRVIAAIPKQVAQLQERLESARIRFATIDAELERLSVWEQQDAYDAAVADLAALTAAFAAEEEQEREQHSPTSSEEEVVLASDAATERDDVETPPIIPPALASLAWMAAEVERRTPHLFTHAEVSNHRSDGRAEDEHGGCAALLVPPTNRPRIRFGERIVRARADQPHAAPTPSRVGTQLRLFE